MRSICARVISAIATLGLSGLTVTGAPSASVAASAQSFEGSFAANRTNLQLRYDASTSHYLGTLRLGSDVFPVDGKVATNTFTGRYLQNAQTVPLKATLAADILTVTYGGISETLRRVVTVGSNGSSTTPKISARSISPSGFTFKATDGTRSAFPIPIPGGGGGGGGQIPLPNPNPNPVPAPKNGKAAAKISPLARAGMRLTFFLGSSTRQTGGVPINPNDVTASAGAGYTQVNVLDVTNGQATAEVRQYLPDSTLNTVYATTTTTSVFPAEAGGEGYWRSPAALAATKDRAKGDETVVRLSYPLDGKTYNAIRTTFKATNSTTQQTYDLDSGVLLSYGFNGTGANGTTQVVQMLFKGARQLRLPWTGERPGPDVTGLRSLSFNGQYTTAVDNAYASTWSMTQDWNITKVDAASVQLEQNTTLMIGNTNPSESKTTLTVGLASLWVDPKVLGTLRTGQVLDDDPITHARVSILGTQNGMLVIGEKNEIQGGAVGYDMRTGIISALQTQQRLGPGTTTVFLQRTT